MENGETSHQGAARETLEEARARVEVGSLYTLFNLPHIDQVYLMFRGRLLDQDFGPGSESLDVRLFRENEIPWEEIAFPVVTETLKLYYRDHQKGNMAQHSGDIIRIDEDIRRYRVSLHELGSDT
jgi:ADP-ribose pyrophosphatase YjhB (NUDIX family)